MGWLIACVLLTLWLRARRWLKAMTELALVNSNTETGSDPEVRGLASYRQVYELSVLRLELSRLQATEVITATHYTALVDHIDAVLTNIVQQAWAEPQSRAWSKSRDAAWALLLLHRTVLSPLPPWHDAVEIERVEAQELAPPKHLSDEISQPVAIPAMSRAAEAAISEPIALPAPVADVGSFVSAPEFVNVETPSSYALDPTPPSVVEQVLQAVSGWPARLIPFMVQNIGWFIGGFCFVAGLVFLVSYTTGFAKALTIFTVLFAYTLLVLWAGYQLCRRRPELGTSSRVLLTIGALLVPLNIAAAVRLIVTGAPAAGTVVLGGLAAAVCVGGLYYAIVLVSGIVNRTLQGRHPQLFLALAAMQLTVPLLMLWLSWAILALLHTMLLVLLIYGVIRFLPDWLHSIFIERSNTIYYAAGTLIYTALVSFIHLTWGYQGPLNLPPSYYGPFLVLLAGVLFYVDHQLKQWYHRDIFLSRLSFAIYGLSIFALFAGAGVPIAQVVTLSLAIVLYAAVMWHYTTLPPLYLLLACSAWLYHTILLAKVSFAGYFLASMPGLAVLYIGSLRALRFQSPIIAQMSFRIWVLAVLGLAGWSIGYAQPGPMAMSTSLMVMTLALFGPGYIPTALLGGVAYSRETLEDFAEQRPWTTWGYVGMLAAVVAIAYAPRWTGLAWEIQLAIGWLGLAQLWTLMGAYQLRTHRDQMQRLAILSAEGWFNGALLTIALLLVAWVGFGNADITSSRTLPLLLAWGGGILLQISWHLGCQWLFYGALLGWGTAGLTVKLTYFPESGSGTTALSAALRYGACSGGLRASHQKS